MNNPLESVIISFYNVGKYVLRAVVSVLKQP